MSNEKLSALSIGTRLKGGDLLLTTQNVSSVLTSLALTGALVDPSPNMPPASPSSLNDEFDEGSLAGIWSWVNQQSTSVAFQNSNIIFTTPASQSQMNLIVQNAPTAPWTITTKLSATSTFANFQSAGLVLNVSGTNAMRVWGWANSINLVHQYWPSPSSDAGTIFGSNNSWPFLSQLYLRIYNDGTNFNFQVSVDGIVFVTLTTVGITATITPNQVGLFVYNSSSAPVYFAFDYFRQT